MAIRARKRLGQHFLHDQRVIERIIAEIRPRPDDSIVEIGSGMGALTLPLLECVNELHVIEIDDRLAESLALADPEQRLRIHRADALKFDYSRICDAPGCLRVVGNLPYNISTPLLFHLLAFRSWIEDMHLMLQKEVVDRITAAPGSKQYGRLTVMLAPFMQAETCFDVGPGAFRPPPKVRSTVARFRMLDEPEFAIDDLSDFSRIVARLFSMRRKTLRRSLQGLLSQQRILALDIDPGARPETLEPAQFAQLAAAAARTDD
jgi:16S rRNA (adenine1518-N6/adenine1519-N6)-dimethyltransferase